MKRNRIIVYASCVVTTLIIACLWQRRSADSRQEPIAEIGATQKFSAPPLATAGGVAARSVAGVTALLQMQAALSTPITFYGKVLDQFGEPVPMAVVEYSTNDNFSGHGTKHNMTADRAGLFTIHSAGVSLSVEVSKSGYHLVNFSPPWDKPGSRNGFEYATVGGDKPHQPDKASPVVFVLRKQGELQPLDPLKEVHFRAKLDGIPVKANITPGKSTTLREITVRVWIDDKTKTATGTFDWRFQLEPVNGGIVSRDGEFEFMAPETGYDGSYSVMMPATLSRPIWQDSTERWFFVRFNDGVFARIRVRVSGFAGGGVAISGFLNPKPGSRNLESAQ